MNFEETLHTQLKELPVPSLTVQQRQSVFDHAHHALAPSRRVRRGGPIAAALTACVVVALLCVGIVRNQMQPRFTLSSWLTTPIQVTALDTPAFRAAATNYIENYPEATASAGSSTTSQSQGKANLSNTQGRSVKGNVQNVSVRWSQIRGQFGYALLSYEVGGHVHLADVTAFETSKSQWEIVRADLGPSLTQAELTKFRLYPGESSVGAGFDARNEPSYDLVFGLVVDPNIVHVRVTWRDGTQTEGDVINGVFGAVRTFSQPTQSSSGSIKIQGVTAKGKVVTPY